jgi:hypothetical protein
MNKKSTRKRLYLWHRIDEGDGYVTFALYPSEIIYLIFEEASTNE